jgi:hypothetical protein
MHVLLVAKDVFQFAEIVNLAICQCIFLDVSEFWNTGCIFCCINLRLFMMFINYCIMNKPVFWRAYKNEWPISWNYQYIIFCQIIFQNIHQFKTFVGLSDCRIIATAPSHFTTLNYDLCCRSKIASTHALYNYKWIRFDWTTVSSARNVCKQTKWEGVAYLPWEISLIEITNISFLAKLFFKTFISLKHLSDYRTVG